MDITKEIIEATLSRAERDIYIAIRKKLVDGKALTAQEIEQYKELSERLEAAVGQKDVQKAVENDKFVWRQKDIAKLFDVTPVAVKSWETYSDFDKSCMLGNGKYDIIKLFRWWYNHFVVNEQALIEIQEAKRRKEVAQAEMKEMEAKELKGELVRKTQVVEDMMYCVEIFKRRLTSLPKILPPLLANQDERTIQKQLHKEVREILEDLANNIEEQVLKTKKEIKRR